MPEPKALESFDPQDESQEAASLADSTNPAPEADDGPATDASLTDDNFSDHIEAPEAESGVPALYLRQLAAYRAVLAKIYPDRRVACSLLWTAEPRLMQISDAALAEHAP